MGVVLDLLVNRFCVGCAAIALCVGASNAPAQRPALSQAAVASLVDDTVKYQLEDLHHPSWALEYRLHRVTDREDTIRETVESTDGNVSRTLERHGQRLSPEEAGAEEQRLRSLTPAELARKHHGDSTDKFAAELIGAMPKAMIYTVSPTQPQLSQVSGSQVVLDFAPNPDFHPSGSVQALLVGLAGKVWIDADTHHLLRIEINIVKNLNLAFGILAHVYEGGTMVYEQHPVGGGHYAYSHIAIDVRLRELMVKTLPYHSTMDTSDVTLLPSPPSLKQAVNMLLSMP